MVEAVKLRNISKKFGKREIISEINLVVKKGESFGIFGGSGCGKTTILRIVAGLETPDTGEVFLRSRKVTADRLIVQPEDRNISFIFQDLGLWPHMSVREHLLFVKKDSNVKDIIDACGLEGHENSKPSELSGGEKQRLAIARSIAQKSDILLLDEPLSSLDLKTKDEIKNLLKQVKKKYRLTLLYVTHDIFEIADVCDEVALIENGIISNVGNPIKLLKEYLKIIDRSRRNFEENKRGKKKSFS